MKWQSPELELKQWTTEILKLACLLLLIIVSPWSLADDSSDQMDVDSELNNVRNLIELTKYEQAIRILNKLVEEDDRKADAWNLLGYSHRKLGNLKIAGNAYERALLYNPAHKGALEYQGELFIELEDLAGARANLDRLEELCTDGCEELTDLEEALARAGR